MNFYAIGIAGGTGSGKTTLANALAREFAVVRDVVVIGQDSYYHDHSELDMTERSFINYDHPDALELELLACQVDELRTGRAIDVPSYNFQTHCRELETTRVEPVSLAIVEGILIFQHAPTRNVLDLKVFVDTPKALRKERRIRRDTEERGRTESAVERQFDASAQPMHEIFVEPSKHHADVIVSGRDPIDTVVREVLSHCLNI